MNREEIDQMGLRLYRDPELAIPMRDALEELGVTWAQWLEESKTLDRLADALAYGKSPILESITDDFDQWRQAVKAFPTYDYVQLCRAFRVPPVRVEVEQNYSQYSFASWYQVSSAIAKVVLKEAVRLDAQNVQQLRRGAIHVSGNFKAILEDYFNQPTRYRIRVGEGPWEERRF